MANKPSKRAKKQILNIAFLVILIAITVTVVFVSQDIDLHDIGNFLAGCNPWYIVAAFGGLLGFILFEALSLHLIIKRLGRRPKFYSSVAYSTSDLYYSAITPSATGGQPASVFYMVRDGVGGGVAGFSVIFNLIAYTVATVLVGLFAVIACPWMFPQMKHWLAQTLVVVGFLIQAVLLAFLILCLLWSNAVLKIGNWGISLLAKIRLVKKPDHWREKLAGVVEKYAACRGVIKQHPTLFLSALLFNVAQRVSQTLIPCFVILAAQPDTDFLQLFCMQAYVMIGYNSIPLPGGTGVYEYLYPNIFGIGGFDNTFVFSAMMVSRGISYYICMFVTGIYTLVYHAAGLRSVRAQAESVKDEKDEMDEKDEKSAESEEAPAEEQGEKEE